MKMFNIYVCTYYKSKLTIEISKKIVQMGLKSENFKI